MFDGGESVPSRDQEEHESEQVPFGAVDGRCRPMSMIQDAQIGAKIKAKKTDGRPTRNCKGVLFDKDQTPDKLIARTTPTRMSKL
jgi:hypothetical protein